MKTTARFRFAGKLGAHVRHLLLMTATPHKGDPDNFCLFLELLDRDVYGDVKSLEEAMRRHEAPFYLHRVLANRVERIVQVVIPRQLRPKRLHRMRGSANRCAGSFAGPYVRLGTDCMPDHRRCEELNRCDRRTPRSDIRQSDANSA